MVTGDHHISIVQLKQILWLFHHVGKRRDKLVIDEDTSDGIIQSIGYQQVVGYLVVFDDDSKWLYSVVDMCVYIVVDVRSYHIYCFFF